MRCQQSIPLAYFILDSPVFLWHTFSYATVRHPTLPPNRIGGPMNPSSSPTYRHIPASLLIAWMEEARRQSDELVRQKVVITKNLSATRQTLVDIHAEIQRRAEVSWRNRLRLGLHPIPPTVSAPSSIPPAPVPPPPAESYHRLDPRQRAWQRARLGGTSPRRVPNLRRVRELPYRENWCGRTPWILLLRGRFCWEPRTRKRMPSL